MILQLVAREVEQISPLSLIQACPLRFFDSFGNMLPGSKFAALREATGMEQLYQTNFTSLDWGIVAGYLACSFVIGVWANRYVGNLSDYLVAGRTLRIRLALATMTGTELGLVTIMYMSELGFKQQYASLYLGVLEAIAFLLIGITGFGVYRLRQTAVLTVPEFYAKRYSVGVRVLGGSVMVLAGVLNMGLFLKAGSQFLTAITGLEDGIYLKWIMSGLLLVVLFYTVLGGMVSVVITDLIQFFVLGVGMLLVCGFVLGDIGITGFAAVVTEQQGYFDPTNPHNPSSTVIPIINPPGQPTGIGLTAILEMAIVMTTAALLWPTSVSRTLSVKTPEVARKLYLYSTIPLLARRAIPILWGIGAYSFFASRPDLKELLQGAIQDNSINGWSAMPLYLAKIIPTGLLGLVTAGMVAAFMSTHDSYLLCWSSVITQDIVAPVFGPLSQRTRILITRISIVAIGGVLLFWGLWYEMASNLWDYMALTGTVYLAGSFPVVVGGLYWKRASTTGAYLAIVGGLFGLLAMGPILAGINQLTPVTSVLGGPISGTGMKLTTFAISLFGFVAGSLCFPDRTSSAALFAAEGGE